MVNVGKYTIHGSHGYCHCEKHVMQDSTTRVSWEGCIGWCQLCSAVESPIFGSPCIHVIAKSMHAIVNNQQFEVQYSIAILYGLSFLNLESWARKRYFPLQLAGCFIRFLQPWYPLLHYVCEQLLLWFVSVPKREVMQLSALRTGWNFRLTPGIIKCHPNIEGGE